MSLQKCSRESPRYHIDASKASIEIGPLLSWFDEQKRARANPACANRVEWFESIKSSHHSNMTQNRRRGRLALFQQRRRRHKAFSREVDWSQPSGGIALPGPPYQRFQLVSYHGGRPYRGRGEFVMPFACRRRRISCAVFGERMREEGSAPLARKPPRFSFSSRGRSHLVRCIGICSPLPFPHTTLHRSYPHAISNHSSPRVYQSPTKHFPNRFRHNQLGARRTFINLN